MVYCCVPYCKSSRGEGENKAYFHEFPSDLNLREKWEKNISRDFIVKDKSVVCNKHFTADDYVPNKKRRCLKKDACPTVFPSYPDYKIPKIVTKRRTIIRNSSQLKRGTEEEITSCKRKKNENESETDGNKIPATQNSDVELLSFFANSFAPQHTTGSSPVACASSSPIKQNQNISGKHNKLLATLKSKVKATRLLKSALCKRKNTIAALKNKIQQLENKVQYYTENSYHSAVEKIIALSDTDHLKATFILEQICNFGKKVPRWSEKMIRNCVLWNAASPKGYNLVREIGLCTLPCKSTLSRFLGPITGEIGVTSLIKSRLGEECSKLNDYEKCASIITDEMAIRQQYVYDKKVDTFFGRKQTFLKMKRIVL